MHGHLRIAARPCGLARYGRQNAPQRGVRGQEALPVRLEAEPCGALAFAFIEFVNGASKSVRRATREPPSGQDRSRRGASPGHRHAWSRSAASARRNSSRLAIREEVPARENAHREGSRGLRRPAFQVLARDVRVVLAAIGANGAVEGRPFGVHVMAVQARVGREGRKDQAEQLRVRPALRPGRRRACAVPPGTPRLRRLGRWHVAAPELRARARAEANRHTGSGRPRRAAHAPVRRPPPRPCCARRRRTERPDTAGWPRPAPPPARSCSRDGGFGEAALASRQARRADRHAPGQRPRSRQ